MPLIDPGKKAPAFSLKDQAGQAHALADYAGRPVVLCFYPKDDTPGCTKEACAFEAQLPAFRKGKAVVLGVSVLDEKSKAKFAAKHGLTFPLLADPTTWSSTSRRLAGEVDVGRKHMGVARMTYLIGADGKVVRRWDDVR